MTTYADTTANNVRTTAGSGFSPEAAADQALEVCEQLLELSSELGAACMEAYEKTNAGIVEFQEKVGTSGMPDWLDPSTWQAGMSVGDVQGAAQLAAERALEVSEKLRERSKQVTLAYLNACEAAALAVADLQEELTAACPVELVQTMGGVRAGLTRQVTRACVSTAREIVG